MSLVQSPPSPRSLPPLDSSLAARLAARDPSQLTNRVFNLATPAVQVYPEWLRGDWIVTSTFAGFVFPSTRIPKDRLTAANNAANIPGFQKCSIIAAHTADIGGPSVRRPWSVDVATGWEDRAFNLQQSASASLGYPAVRTVTYNPRRNPNRISMDFTDYRTVNAERIELFCNARESSNAIATSTNIQNGTTDAPPPTFVCAEYLRQVTFGTGSTVGVPRQAVTNYANFWTYQPNTVVCDTTDKKDEKTSSRSSSIINQWTGNVLTAAYLDPQDPMYFDEPSQPVVVYSHSLSATRR